MVREFRAHFPLVAMMLAGSLLPSQAQELLPLAPGNKWTLSNPYVPQPMVLQVVSDELLGSKRRVRVSFTNPWTAYDFVFNPTADGVMLEGLAVGANVYYLNEPAVFFPATGVVGTTWTTAAGSVTLLSTSAIVNGTTATYTGCRHYRVNLFQGVLDWFLAPGIGFVQIGTAPGHFVPGPIVLNTYVPPPVVATRAGVCPKLGIDSNPASNSTFSTAERESILAAVQAVGVRFAHVSAKWSDIERSPRSYDFSQIAQWMSSSTKYSFDIALTIRTVDTTTISMPSDLVGRSLNDPVVIDRFVAMMTALAPALNSRVQWVNLGNEVDVYLQNTPEAAPGILSFFQTAKSRLASLYGARTFGVVFTHAARSMPAAIAPIIAASDHVSFTYYPLNADLSVRAPSVVPSEIAEILAQAGGKPVVLTEIGYPTATLLGSDESMQAAFITAVLKALRGQSGKVVAASFFQRSDMPSQTVNTLVQYYNASGTMNATTVQRVAAFIGSLGMHTATGAAKPGWNAFTVEVPTFTGATACTTN